MDDGSRCLRLKAKLSNYILIDEESRDTICIVNFWWCKSLRKCIFNNIQNGLKSYALILQKLTIILSITQLRIFFQNMAFHVLNRLWLNCVTLEIALDDWLNISRFKVHPRSTFSALQEHQSECMNKNHCLYFIRQYLYFEFFADAYYDIYILVFTTRARLKHLSQQFTHYIFHHDIPHFEFSFQRWNILYRMLVEIQFNECRDNKRHSRESGSICSMNPCW